MISHVKFVSVPIRDQDKALAFYAKKLGFQVVKDEPFMDGVRWIELVPSGGQTHVVLFTPPEHRDRVGTFSSFHFTCDDVRKTYDELKERGVEFTASPTEYPWGIAAQFVDPDGNQFLLSSHD